MLTGRRAYPQASTEAALARLTSPPQIPGELSSGWRTLLTRMTAIEPSERPSADEVARELRRLSGGEDATAVTAVMAAEVGSTRVMPRPPPPVSPSPASAPDAATRPAPVEADRGRTSSPRRWTLIASLVGLAVVVLIIAVFVLPGGGTTGDEVPDGVPPGLEQPLGELHDAVNGGS